VIRYMLFCVCNSSAGTTVRHHLVPRATGAMLLMAEITATTSGQSSITAWSSKRQMSSARRTLTVQSLMMILVRQFRHASLLHVRPLVEYNSTVWSPLYLKHDIYSVKSVWRRFTKCLPDFGKYAYSKQLELVN